MHAPRSKQLHLHRDVLRHSASWSVSCGQRIVGGAVALAQRTSLEGCVGLPGDGGEAPGTGAIESVAAQRPTAARAAVNDWHRQMDVVGRLGRAVWRRLLKPSWKGNTKGTTAPSSSPCHRALSHCVATIALEFYT